MSAFVNKFPTSVLVDGVPVKINTDFRAILRIQQAFSDDGLTEPEKIEVMMKILYCEPISNIREAIRMGMKFINLGEEITPTDEPPIYSFDKDSKYIYTAFQSSYGIDLEAIEYLHWWKFRTLFSDLGECFFSQLVGIRSRMITGELMDSEKKFIAKNPEVVYISDEPSAIDDFLKEWESE